MLFWWESIVAAVFDRAQPQATSCCRASASEDRGSVR